MIPFEMAEPGSLEEAVAKCSIRRARTIRPVAGGTALDADESGRVPPPPASSVCIASSRSTRALQWNSCG